ncbi:hypothetical protein T03_12679 [Trichinella britovi]|uniref:Uncharacterized protein n=1 Tax=Trichinella britovi TaxID=45882 RepID=A0A0V1C7Y1_TRIBR|nr:hypothetical protein T03_12679 [Trichinella britovi]
MLSMTLWKHATPFVTPNGTMVKSSASFKGITTRACALHGEQPSSMIFSANNRLTSSLMNFASAIGYLLYFTATNRRWLRELLVRKKRQSDLNVVVPVSLHWNEVEVIRTFPSAVSSFSSTVLNNRSSIKLRELPLSIRAVILVPLILASTMAFFNSVAVGEEELINDVTETEAVRLDAVLHTFAK